MRLERLARDKHSSLLPKLVNYGCNRFYDTGDATQTGLLLFVSQHPREAKS
jgi:hypothetical protein